jgi:hypothetical protein
MSPDYINFSAPTKSTKEGQKKSRRSTSKKRIAIFKYKTLKKGIPLSFASYLE